MSSQAFYTGADGLGDFYDALVVTSAGESPETTPEKWRRVDVPADWEEALVAYSAAHILPGEGQLDKSRAEKKNGEEELELLIWRNAVEHGRSITPRVFTR